MVFATSVRNPGTHWRTAFIHSEHLQGRACLVNSCLPDSWFRAWNGVTPQKMFVEVSKILSSSDNSSTQKRRDN